MWGLVFERLYHGVRAYDDYFITKKDAIGTIEFAGYQKCTAAMRMLAHDTIVDPWDGYLRMFESTCLEVMVKYCYCSGEGV